MARRIQILPSQYKATVRPRNPEERDLALVVELGHLRTEVKRLNGVIKFKDETLLDEIAFLEDVLRSNTPQSIDGLKRRISRLKGAVDRIQGGLE